MNKLELLKNYLIAIKSLSTQMDKLPEFLRAEDEGKEEYVASKVSADKLTTRVYYYSESGRNEELDCVKSELQELARTVCKNAELYLQLEDIHFKKSDGGVTFYADVEVETDKEWCARIAKEAKQAEQEYDIQINDVINKIMSYEKALLSNLRKNLL